MESDDLEFDIKGGGHEICLTAMDYKTRTELWFTRQRLAELRDQISAFLED